MSSPALEPVTPKLVLKLALPAMGQLVLEGLVFMLDSIMLGHYSTTALAATRLNSALHWSLYTTLSSFTVGTVAVMGRAVGSADRPIMGAVVRSSLGLAMVTGILVTIGITPLLPGILSLFPTSNQAVQVAAFDYLSIVVGMMPLELLAITAAAILQAMGDTRTPFLVGCLANIINVAANYSLIFGHWGAPELGIRGAAIATAAAFTFMAIALLSALINKASKIALWQWGNELSVLRRIIYVGSPAYSERLFRSFGYLAFNGILSALGGAALAAHEALIRWEELGTELGEGVGIATSALVAQRLGAQKVQDAIHTTKISLSLAVSIMSTVGLLLWLMPELFLSLFSPSDEMLAVAIPTTAVVAIAQPFMATSITLEHTLRGAGDTRTAFWIAVMGWFVVRLSVTAIAVWYFHLGLVGIWIGSTCDWIVRALLLTWQFCRGRWYKVNV